MNYSPIYTAQIYLEEAEKFYRQGNNHQTVYHVKKAASVLMQALKDEQQ